MFNLFDAERYAPDAIRSSALWLHRVAFLVNIADFSHGRQKMSLTWIRRRTSRFRESPELVRFRIFPLTTVPRILLASSARGPTAPVSSPMKCALVESTPNTEIRHRRRPSRFWRMLLALRPAHSADVHRLRCPAEFRGPSPSGHNLAGSFGPRSLPPTEARIGQKLLPPAIWPLFPGRTSGS